LTEVHVQISMQNYRSLCVVVGYDLVTEVNQHMYTQTDSF